jgi:DNA-binding FadR family transcriptional regulator
MSISSYRDHLNDWDKRQERSEEFDGNIDEHRRLLDVFKSSLDRDARRQIWARIEELGRKLNEHVDALPPNVADAIFILRHEEVGR